MKSRRIGAFSIWRRLIDENPEEARALMGQCIILRAEMMLHTDCIEYIAISEQFPEINPGDTPTRICWHKTKDGPWVAEY